MCILQLYGTKKVELERQEQQTQQIQEINDKLEYLDAEIKIINNQVKHQQMLLDKTSGRLYKEHIDNDETPNRGSRDSIYTFKVQSPSKFTAYELNYVLQNTALEGLGEAYIRAELNTGVNALFLTALSIQESGWGESYIARDKNNLFGYGSYDNSAYESSYSFESKEECIEYVAKQIADNYCDENGAFYRGGTIADVNYYYCTTDTWGQNIFDIMNKLEVKKLESYS